MQNVEVHLMHNSIRIGSFPKNCMPQYVHALLKVVLDASLPGGPKKQFLHLVYTEDEVTVMFDDSVNLPITNSPPAGTEPLADGEQTSSPESTEPEQPKEGITLFPDEWCAITVVAGASGGSGDVLLASVRHLASVTVFYASTYETDYLLVQKSKVDMVMNLFKALGYKLRDRRCASVETEYVSETESSGYDDLAPNTEPLTMGTPRPLINNDLEVGMAW
ncbi:hypothetical protein SARC_01826 [Sphaeroforma arctica JP610]|uniref:CASTOR ACT domain-containing protein n=1 Tax=Sphaeroforma arctica JP610 TaxID=667725 RepID=A0A0L0GAV3_9EUKA|nr:hypothetical protein SARC_01826 [Sphaeroforma arctica JP610]KNC86026.1 hypothetical protein SARC_01826 [Sphaeroforma arctica JP610]|eukprot:XP_014159928.1 hypothetical protein SARC_01826 [Sphaeroforma arctica JP610]